MNSDNIEDPWGKSSIIYASVVDPDPDPTRIQEQGNWPKFTNKLGFLPFKKAFVPSYVCFWPITYLKYTYFSCKNSTFCNIKVWPRSESGSNWISIALAIWIQIRIRICTEIKSWIGNTVPYPNCTYITWALLQCEPLILHFAILLPEILHLLSYWISSSCKGTPGNCKN